MFYLEPVEKWKFFDSSFIAVLIYLMVKPDNFQTRIYIFKFFIQKLKFKKRGINYKLF